MLVILIDDRILAHKIVCQGCLLADRQGEPRWQGGQLCVAEGSRSVVKPFRNWLLSNQSSMNVKWAFEWPRWNSRRLTIPD